MSQQDVDIDALMRKTLPHAAEESQDYEAPFTTLTWKEWLDLQTQMVHCFTRFQRAISYQQAKVAVGIAREMIEIGTNLLYEATDWIGFDPK